MKYLFFIQTLIKWIWFFIGQVHYEAIMANGKGRVFVTPVNFVPKDEWFQLILSCETFQVFIILVNITLLETSFNVSDLFVCAIRKLSCYKCLLKILFWIAYVQRAKAWKINVFYHNDITLIYRFCFALWNQLKFCGLVKHA